MNWREFETKLRDLGWSQGELASRLGLNRNTVSRWKQEDEVPKYASAYLELALVIHSAHLAMNKA